MHAEGLAATAERLEQLDRLDPVVDVLSSVGRPLAEGSIRPVLAGQWLGHSLHPLLTDFPLGCWTSASLLDLVGGRGARTASRRLVVFGVLTALPTAATGMSDWAHTGREAQRVGVVHAACNSAALVCYSVSYLARRGDRHARGVLLGIVGGLAAVAGGFFGGHLTLTAAVTRDNVLLPQEPSERSATVPAPPTSAS
jgi:uncharacterized membrane protein